MATQILGKVAYTSRGAYDSSFSYEINDVVTYNGSSYVSKKETKGNLPTNEEYWMLLAEKGATYQVTKEDLNNIANEITADANSAFNQNVTSKTNAFDANATSQTSAFDNNANAKTTSYNNNATSALNSYNSNASSKLDAYDKNHNEKVEAYNSNANTKLEEFNTNASSYDERITDNTNRTKRIENTLYDSGEASGSSINIKDSTLAEFQEISVDGVCKQETTTGINKLDMTKLTPQTINGVTVTPNKDGSITFNGVMEKAIFIELSNRNVNLPSGEYTWSLRPNQSLPSGDYTLGIRTGDTNVVLGAIGFYESVKKLTLSEDLSNGFFAIYISGSKTFNNFTIYPMLVEGSYTKDTLPPFEQFSGGVASPSPSWEQPIEVIEEGFDVVSCGKQLLKNENQTRTSNDVTTIVENETINASGVVTANWTNLTTGEKTKANLQKGKKYTMVLNQPAPYNFYAKNGEQYITIYKGQKTTSFTQKDEYKSIYFFIAELTSGTEISINDLKVMIYEGEYDTTRNDFEPYQETRVPINLPDGEFVGKINETAKDQVRIAFNEDDGEYQNNLYKVLARDVLNGSEDGWEYVEQYNYFRCPSYVFSETPTGNMSERMCSHFKVIANWTEFRDDSSVNGIVITKDGYKICIRNTNCSTVEEFKQALSESPVTIIYKIAEPYEVNLGVVDMPLSYSPETNVFTTSELEALINAKYYRNFINTIQNLQVNEKALKEELVDINSRLSALETNLVNLANVEEVENQENESEVI